jgi:uncharacterized membrane protein
MLLSLLKDHMTTSSSPQHPRTSRLFAPLAGVTSVSILCQAVTAGQFFTEEGREAWIVVHNIVGYVTLVLAVATAVVGLRAFRKSAPSLGWASLALAVLVAVQLVIGHLITDAEQDGWIGVHVPLALVVFGLTGWLAVKSAALRRLRSTAP